jgi:hypothetical protein
LSKNVKNLSKISQKVVKKFLKISQKFVENLSKMFLKKLSIICHFAQIVQGRRRRRRRRLLASRPGGYIVVPGNNCKHNLFYLLPAW